MKKNTFLTMFLLLLNFALWGVVNNMTDNLVPAFQRIFTMDQDRAVLVQVSFYGAYAVLALFTSILVEEFSFRTGILIGLGTYMIGALLYIPACIQQSFDFYFIGIFVVAGGCAILEASSNPCILAIGDPKSAIRRLNFAQAINPVGSIVGIFLAQKIILAHLNPATVEERLQMAPDALAAIRHTELVWICVPYVGLCLLLLLIWCYFLRHPIHTEVESGVDKGPLGRRLLHVTGAMVLTAVPFAVTGWFFPEMDKLCWMLTGMIGPFCCILMMKAYRESLFALVRTPRYVFGLIALFCYVGMQIAVWTWMNAYGQKELGVSPETSANYYLLAIAIHILNCWGGSYAMKWIAPWKIMAAYCVLGAVCCFGTVYLPSDVLFTCGETPFSANILCLMGISLFMAILFPTIYGIALGGLDPKCFKLGGPGMIMAILGGAVITPWMASVISEQNASFFFSFVPGMDFTWDANLRTSSGAIRASFYIPVICFAAMFLYAVVFGPARRRLKHLLVSAGVILLLLAVPVLHRAPGGVRMSGITRMVRDSGWTRVSFVLNPTTSSWIRCELALPDPEKWDGRLWGHGNGGWAGRCLCLRGGMKNDFSAHVQCDLGTSRCQTGPLPAPPEIVDDFLWRATHLMTVEAKRIVREFYGRDADHAYFTGASTGGRQALFEAYFFPEDYDGIVSEVPYFNWLDDCAFAWRVRELRRHHGCWFSAAEQEAVREAELVYFATVDPEWARGRFIVDPRPTPEKLDGCWREIVRRQPALADREALWRALFEPVVVRGRQLACERAIGMEFNSAWSFMYPHCVGPVGFDEVTEDTLADLADRMLFDRGNPDLGAFRQHGGRLLMYSGHEDASVPSPPVTRFYDSLCRNLGGAARVQEFCRYFTVPGRTHGALGAAFGKGQIGLAPEIEDRLVAWVERGEAPEELEFTFAAKDARLAVGTYPGNTVRLVPATAGEHRERTEFRELKIPCGEVLEGVRFNGVTVLAAGGRVSARGAEDREGVTGDWSLASREVPVTGEDARAFRLTVRNTGKTAADMTLELVDPSRTAWMGGNTLKLENVPAGASRTVYGGRITASTPQAKWFLGKFPEDGDGIFARCFWSPLK